MTTFHAHVSASLPLVLTVLCRSIFAAGVAIALAVAVDVPALAASYNHTDARHDVKAYPRIHAPHNRKSDVTHLRIVHGDKDVRFYIRFRSASMHGVRFRGFRVALKTPSHTYQADFDLRHGRERDDLIDKTTGQQVTCDQSISRNGHTFVIRTHRDCLGNPSWIRAAFITSASLGFNKDFSDDPLSSYWGRPDGGGPFSPRVRSST